MADLDTYIEVMAEDALRHGRPRRRRRILVSVAGGIVTMALLCGIGAYGISAISTSQGQPVSPAGPGPTAPAATPNPPQTSTPTPTERSAKARPMTIQMEARVAALYLTRLAPDGVVTEYQGQQAPDEIFVGAQIDRGEGKVGLQVNVQANFFGGPSEAADSEVAEFYRCQRGAEAGLTYSNCDVVRNDDGSVLMTYSERVPEGRSSKARAVVADFLRSDGTRVVVRTGNVSDLKYGGKPRRGVSLAEARAIVVDPTWDITRTPSPKDVADARRVIKPWQLIPS